jgi:hypothetical protein
VSTSDTESSDLLSPELDILLGELLSVLHLEVLDGRPVVWQLIGRVLRVLGELELTVSVDGSLGGLKSAGDKVEQSGFTGTVVTDNSNSNLSARYRRPQ